jgi:uncharacterized protein YdeI (YjbR/CyaY-like superfamily)
MAVNKPQPVFFATPAELRRWFTANHRKVGELWVGFHKKGSGRPSVDWPQSVDQALCFGWIDGVRKSLGPDSYTIRFTPRRAGSHWSNVNINRVAELTRMGQMKPAGQQAFAARSQKKSGRYSYEQRHQARLSPAQTRHLKANAAAWTYFQAQAPWYQRITIFWVASAKQEATQARRLEQLIAHSAAGEILPGLRRPGGVSSPRKSTAAP